MTKSNLLPALGEGFRLIGREPLSVLVWGLVSFVAAVIPALAYWAIVGPEMVQFYGDLAKVSGSGAGEMPTPPGMTGGAALVQLLQFVLMPVSGALVFAGVYRAVLRPEERGIGHVRFISDEFHVGVSLVVMYVLMVVVTFLAALVIMIPMFIGIAIAAASGGAVAMLVIMPLVMIALLVVLAVVFSRFGMALPMSFDQKQIRVFEGWTYTKGYAGQLLAMVMLQLLLILALYFAVALVAFAAMAGVITDFGAGFDTAQIEGLFQDPDALLQRFLPFIVVGGVIYLVVMFVMQPILIAPWAKAYQLIAGDKMRAMSEATFN